VKVIWKYQPDFGAVMEIETREGAQLLSVQTQWDKITFWFLVDTEMPLVTRTFEVIGTGHEMYHPENYSHVATVQQEPFVWHIFEPVPGRAV